MPSAVDVSLRGSREALNRVEADDIAAYVDLAGLGAGDYTLTVHADVLARRGRHAHRTRDRPGANHQCQKLIPRSRVSSAPTACAAPPAGIRSIRRRCAGSARRSCARCRTAPESPRVCSSAATRASPARWIEAELAHGASGEGATVTSAGVVPTPAVAYLTRTAGYDAGVVISASHNPFEDNGIKVFSGRGEKFTERVEREVEAIVADASWAREGGDAGTVAQADLVGAYLDHLRAVFPEAPAPLRASGSPSTAPTARRRRWRRRCSAASGSTLVVIGNQPDGRNINLHCGSTHPGAALARTVVEHGLPDGRRVRRRRRPRDLRRSSRPRRQRRRRAADVRRVSSSAKGRLKGNAIVATVMSNIGLEIALRALGIDLVRCPVGDKYVMEEMLKRDLSLGGEQSGHIIFSDYLFTGDGLCTALNVLRTVALTGRTLADLASDLTSYPQVLLNVRVREKVDLADGARRRRGHRARRSARRGPGPPAGALLGHRAAAARDARRARTSTRSAPGRRRSSTW